MMHEPACLRKARPCDVWARPPARSDSKGATHKLELGCQAGTYRGTIEGLSRGLAFSRPECDIDINKFSSAEAAGAEPHRGCSACQRCSQLLWDAMLEVEHLTRRYGPVTAVDDISFQTRSGEILGFLGPNGAGKTTTMRMITGYLPPTAGEVRIEGVGLRRDPLAAKRKIGYLPELPPLYPELTVRDYLLFVSRLRQVPARDRRSVVERAMERCALSDVSGRVIGRLSKGYRQRVGIAQAILHNPRLLIFDEPTAGLDPRQILETRQLIRSLAGDHTVILSTHILSEAANTCQRVIIINRGKLVAVDSPENLTRRVKQTDTLLIELRGVGPAAQAAVAQLPGVSKAELLSEQDGIAKLRVEAKDLATREAIARTLVERGDGLLELKEVELTLEETFLSLTGSGLPAAGSA
jgi:ABC-2 type transport system ATP-binding protein